ncbi:MAG: ABC transporter permease [Pseudomonadaceae bacterium]|nr:ABC transporter permease [Pseudomonadaceae bacterium]
MPIQARVLTGEHEKQQALSDLWKGVTQWRIWTALAMEDLRRRYHRAAIGLLWVTLSFCAFIVVKALVFNRFAGSLEFSFAIYLALGFLLWQFMNGVVTDGADVFVSASNWIKGVPMPLSTFVYQSIVRNLVVAGYSSLVIGMLLLYEGHALSWGALLALPALVVLVFTSIWVELLLGVVSARYRDVKHLIQTIMRILFFLTPVLWVPSVMGRLGEYTYWNPFANFIEIVRMPLLTGSVDSFHWIYVCLFSVLGAVVSVIVFMFSRHRIVYWI